jgi:serine phosphatase RsbU (regulator of sigma subunit)
MATALPLGIAPEPIELEQGCLPVGHLLAFLTDGVTESRIADGRLLGVEGFADRMRDICAASHHRDLASLARHMNEWLDGLEERHTARDDRSFIVAKRP